MADYELFTLAAALHCSTETFLLSGKHFTSRAEENRPNSPKTQWQGHTLACCKAPLTGLHPCQPTCLSPVQQAQKHLPLKIQPAVLKAAKKFHCGFFFSRYQEQVTATVIDKVTQSLCVATEEK